MRPAALLAGGAMAGAGLALMAATIVLFARVGEGTLAPWDPTRKFVARGPYRYVRNPMISGVLAVLLGESLLTRSVFLFVWFVLFAAGNFLYIPHSEEPGLLRRFGEEYRAYLENVPRWIPRRTPWDPRGQGAGSNE